METTAAGWTILDEAAGIRSRTYVFNDKGGTATTFVARLPSGEVLVISPASNMSEEGFAELDSLGTVTAVVAPSGFHHLGVREWRTRYPEARFFAPRLAMPRIAKQNPDAGTFEAMDDLAGMLGDDIGVHELADTKHGEIVAWAKAGDGWIWFMSDLLCNWDAFPGNALVGFLWKLSGSGPGFKPFKLAAMAMLADKKAVWRWVLGAMRERPPTVVVPAHGAIVTGPDTASRTITLLEGAL